jgi:hypothetical protein
MVLPLTVLFPLTTTTPLPLPSAAVPGAVVPTRFAVTELPEVVTRTPSEVLPAIRLPCPVPGPPTEFGDPPARFTPNVPLPTACRPSSSVPIRLPRTALFVALPEINTPSRLLPDMTFRPPVVPSPSALLLPVTVTPVARLGTASSPVASRPTKFPSTSLPLTSSRMPETTLPETTLPAPGAPMWLPVSPTRTPLAPFSSAAPPAAFSPM